MNRSPGFTQFIWNRLVVILHLPLFCLFPLYPSHCLYFLTNPSEQMHDFVSSRPELRSDVRLSTAGESQTSLGVWSGPPEGSQCQAMTLELGQNHIKFCCGIKLGNTYTTDKWYLWHHSSPPPACGRALLSSSQMCPLPLYCGPLPPSGGPLLHDVFL